MGGEYLALAKDYRLNLYAEYIHTSLSMLVTVIICVIAAIVAAFWMGYIAPPHASVLIRIRGGTIRVTRGAVQSHAQAYLVEILASEGVAHGYIALLPGNRIVFSRQIPARLHQRLRNVLSNQWV